VTATYRSWEERDAGNQVEARLRRLTSASANSSSVLDAAPPAQLPSGLDDKTAALVRLAAVVAMRAPASSYLCTIDAALAGGATDEEVIGTMIAVAPTVGLARLVSATVGLALALGYDLDAALERLGPPADHSEPSGCCR
jgi:alkylhydroperoxidase/carboxymuconolactone decarboxylase family protein YurZ